ncbi:MAG: hypothetical protein QXP44_04555 [Candidatus Bathyarchaeia archaeon]
MGVYVGIKEKAKPEIFEAETAPTKESHPQYDFVYGPFKTVKDAQKYVEAMSGLACGDG